MTPTLILVGALSVYHPGDGHNAGTLSCGGKFTWQQSHIAIRQWRQVGCGAIARVCTPRRCVWTTVQDSGPWGARHPDGRWEVQITLKPGWRRRAVVDLSHALWVRLGKPRFRSPVHITIWRKR